MYDNPIDETPLRPPPVGTGLLGVAPTIEVLDEQPFEETTGDTVRRVRRVVVYGEVHNVNESEIRSRWEGGMSWLPEGCKRSGVAGIDCGGSIPIDTDDLEIASNQRFQPFDVWAYDECATVDQTRDRWGRAERALRGERSFQIAGELERGAMAIAEGAPSAYLEDNPTVLALGTANFESVFIALDGALSRELRNRQGMVHMTPDHLAAAQDLQLVRWNGQTPYTPNGHVIVADAGYTALTTDDPSSRIYGTDMIRVLLGPILFTPRKVERDGTDQGIVVDTNDRAVRAHQAVGLQWDRCAHLAADSDIGVALPEFAYETS